jgi:Uma2 family endonuclease
MTAEAIGSNFPAVVTLDDVAAMNAADRFGHRYELSPEGTLWVTPLADSEHAAIASQIQMWFLLAGWPPARILQAVGIRIHGPDGAGGRIPDLTVWSAAPSAGRWLPPDNLAVAVEIMSAATAAIDEIIKAREYAAAGIPRYWVVERDAAQTVTLHVLRADHTYEVAAKMPLAWLLQTKPADHNL